MGREETKASGINVSVINPRWAKTQAIEDQVTDLMQGCGSITLFSASTHDANVRMVEITPLDLLEARELSPRGRDKFIREVTKKARTSGCAIVQSVSLTPRRTNQGNK